MCLTVIGVNMPLTFTNVGDSACVRALGGKDVARQRLMDLGFTVGSRVTVVGRLSDSLIVKVKDARIALDGTMARNVLI
jgi:ferrous iron transport protein A